MKALFLVILIIFSGCSNTSDKEEIYTKIIFTTGVRDSKGNFIEQSR